MTFSKLGGLVSSSEITLWWLLGDVVLYFLILTNTPLQFKILKVTLVKVHSYCNKMYSNIQSKTQVYHLKKEISQKAGRKSGEEEKEQGI